MFTYFLRDTEPKVSGSLLQESLLFLFTHFLPHVVTPEVSNCLSTTDVDPAHLQSEILRPPVVSNCLLSEPWSFLLTYNLEHPADRKLAPGSLRTILDSISLRSTKR